MASKNLLMVGVAVVAVAAIAYFGFMQNPADDDVAGTIGAVQRHNTVATTDSDVILGDQALSNIMQNEIFVQLTEDPELRAIIADPDFIALAADPRFAVVMANSQFSDQLSQFVNQGGQIPQQQDGAVVSVVDARFMALSANPRFAVLAANQRFVKLAANPRFAELAANPDFSLAMGSPGISTSIVTNYASRGFTLSANP
jgi:hypothetical protein